MERFTLRGVVVFFSLFLAAGLLTGCSDDVDNLTQEVADENGSVSGQVVQGDTQQPVRGLTVEVRSGDIETTETDENGLFEVDGLAPTILTPVGIGGVGPPAGTVGGQGHLVTISDQREVADDPTDVGEDEIASEADRLATKQYRVHIGQDIGGANQPFDVDMGIIAMNQQGTIIAQVNLEDGTAAPDGVTVVARPLGGTNTVCSGPLQNINPVVAVTTVAVPVSATTVSGAATLNGLDKCQNYTVNAPAQVVNGVQHVTAVAVTVDLATVEDINASTRVALVLIEAVLDEPLVLVSTNISPSTDILTFLGNPTRPILVPSFAFTFLASTNVSSFDPVGFGGGTIGLANPAPQFSAPLTGDIVLVFNLPVELASGVALTFNNDLVDPDPDDTGGNSPAGFPAGTGATLAGVTATFDTSQTVLTISHTTALTANQIYTLQGTLRTIGSNNLNNLSTLASSGVFGGAAFYILPGTGLTVPDTNNGAVYATDSSTIPAVANISADNLNGSSTVTNNPTQVFLQFPEAVAGTMRLVSQTANGTTTVINGGNVAILPSGGTRLASFFGDGTPPCTICRGSSTSSDGTTFSFAIPGVFLNDNSAATSNSVEVFLEVVDTQGDIFVDTLTLNIQ